MATQDTDGTEAASTKPAPLEEAQPVPATPPLTQDDKDNEAGWQTVGASKKDTRKEPARAPPPSEAAAPLTPQAAEDGDEKEEEDSDDEDDDDDSSAGAHGGEEIQLGFAEPIPEELRTRLLFQDPDWHEWDGGKVGGKPVWLNTKVLPPRALLDCASCQEPLSFILQIYCPLDDPPEAFHRVLYVFACRKPRCAGPGCAKVLRCQLPQQNPLYVYDPSFSKRANVQAAVSREAQATKTCAVCGQGATKVCSRCKSLSYCSRAHQKEGWKAGHKQVCQGAKPPHDDKEEGTKKEGESQEAKSPAAVVEEEAVGMPCLSRSSVFPEYEIVIEEERPPTTKQGEEEDDQALLRKYKDVVVTETDDDARVGQKHLDKATGANPALKDKQSLRFLATVGHKPDQVLRYARWNDKAPLWVSSEDQPQAKDVPACAQCGGTRAFEFQVMPQLLHYLKVDAMASLPCKPGDSYRLAAMDWGTLAVYTCTNSCSGGAGEGGGYVEEFLWRQKPME